MATTHGSQTPATDGGALPPLNDGDIIMSVSGKDAGEGYRYILPAPKLPASLAPEHAIAANVGYYREAITPAQNAATKARKGEYKVKRETKAEDGTITATEVALNEREAVADFLANFKPSEDRELPTVGNRRKEIANEMVAAALASRGLPAGEADVQANMAPWLAGPKGTGDNAKTLDKALRDWLALPYKPAKRGSGGASKDTPAAAPQDW